ncbi:hypothetical protein SVIOM74S_10509 [Streptomyces violarus]
MTCSVSRLRRAPARLTVSSRTPPGTAQAAVTSWPGSSSTTPSTRSRTHHAPAGPSAVVAMRARLTRTGEPGTRKS